jgi:hypothetical protein
VHDEPAPPTDYALLVLNAENRWVILQTFRDPLRADRTYEALRQLGMERRLRLVQMRLLADTHEEV